MKNREEIIEILQVVRHTTSDIEKQADKICDLFNVSNCECKNLPKGEIAISSKALTDPNWKS